MKEIRRVEWFCFAGIMILALFLRIYRLDDVPPGLLPDTAINGLDAWRLFQRGGHTLFLTGNGGREALFIYLQGISIWFLGTTAVAARLPGVVIDGLTVGLTFWFARWLIQDSRFRIQDSGDEALTYKPVWFVLWVGLAMAGSHWLLVVSRLGFRGVLVPLASVICLGAFAVAWSKGKEGWKWFILAGVALGLAGYTYTAAKVLPLILGVSVLPALFKRPVRPKLIALLGVFGVATLVYVPMLWYTWRYPGPSTERAFSVALWAYTDTFQNLLVALGENIWATLGYFCCQGNIHLILFGLPGRAAFDVGLGLILGLGCVLAVFRWRGFTQRLLLSWFVLGLLPGILAIEAPHPLRIIAAAPPAFLLLGQGLAFLVRGNRWLALVATIWLVFSAGSTFRDYFQRWPNLPATQVVFEIQQRTLAEQIITRTEAGEVIYLNQTDYARFPLRYYLSGPLPPQANVLGLTQVEETTFIKGLEPSVSGAWVRLGAGHAEILPPLVVSSLPPGETQGKIPSITKPFSFIPLKANFNPPYQVASFTLQGVTFPQSISKEMQAGTPLGVTLLWQSVAQVTGDYEVLVQLLNDTGQAWSLNEAGPFAQGAYPTTLWRPLVDSVPDYHPLILQTNLPSGRYWLGVALLDPRTGARQPFNSAGDFLGDTLRLGPIKVPLEAGVDYPFEPITATFGPVAELSGFAVEQTMLNINEPLRVILRWQGVSKMTVDYTVFVHLLDEAGERVAGQDSQPVRDTYPTSIWSPGEVIVDEHFLETVGVPPGHYTLVVGLYDGRNGERLPVGAETTINLPVAVEVLVLEETSKE